MPNPLKFDMQIEVVELKLERVYTLHIPGDVKEVYGVKSAGPIFCKTIGNCNVERAAMLSLDTANQVINYFTISVGNIDSVKVSLAQLFRAALLSNAVKIIVAHNHPSGILTITPEDIEMTRKIGFFAKCFDIQLIDSLVVSGETVLSVREYCGELIK